MATQIETVGSLERRLSMSLPVATIDKEVGERLRRLARSERMPGFRPGHVPLTLIQQRYGMQVRGEVIGNAVAGEKEDLTSLPFIWRGGKLRELLRPPGYAWARVTAINERGQIIGQIIQNEDRITDCVQQVFALRRADKNAV